MSRSKTGKLIMGLGLLLIAAALVLSAYNVWDSYRAGKSAEDVLAAMDEVHLAALSGGASSSGGISGGAEDGSTSAGSGQENADSADGGGSSEDEAKDGKHSEAVLVGYVNDSHKEPMFATRLTEEVISINNEVRKLLQHEVNAFYQLYLKMQELMLDVKKSRSDVVSNIRVLFSSTRNRDAADQLDRQFADWQVFLDIMGNYTVISENAKPHE